MIVYEASYHSGYGQRLAEQWSDEGYRRWDHSGELVEERPLNEKETVIFAAVRDEEDTRQRRATARDGVTDLARAALRGNKAYLDLPVATPDHTAGQVAALTRQMNALVRLVLDDFDDQEGG